MKGLINTKISDNKCFLWCHIWYLNPSKIHPERITKADREMACGLDYQGFKFPVSEKDFGKMKRR